MKKYRYIIFDADDTLIQFSADQERAFRAAFAVSDVAATEGALFDCHMFSHNDWAELGLCDVHLPNIQASFHELYRVHIKNVVNYVAPKYGLKDRDRAEAEFVRSLALAANYIEGADSVVTALARNYRVCVATNGLREIQAGRLSVFAPHLYRVFISEEVGAVKPERAFFSNVLTELNASADECLMVGDSLVSDVAGANAAGIDCVWYNPKRVPLPDGYSVIEEIPSLSRLTELL